MRSCISDRAWGKQALVLLGALALTSGAWASYLNWEMVELPASSGASCGNGTPYRFFVNRTPFTTNTVVMFEGGGACWDQRGCEGLRGLAHSASNPNGIPTNYLTSLTPNQPNSTGSPLGKTNLSMLGLITPFTARLHPLQSVQTQKWNIVYVPYCTGDVHTGNSVQVYTDSDPSHPRVQYHKGYLNVKAVSAWLATNMPQPDKLLVTGFSAGGVGSQAAYPTLRPALRPKQAALLADSGPLAWAPSDGDAARYPSLPLHRKVRVTWGYDRPDGILTETLQRYPGVGDQSNLGSFLPAVSRIFPSDRVGITLLKQDLVFPGFSYDEFHQDIQQAPDEATRNVLRTRKWNQDIRMMVDSVRNAANVGWYLPYGRNLTESHCTTFLTFSGTAIAEAGLANVGAMVDNLIDGKGTPIRAEETAQVMQSPTGVSWIDNLINGYFDSLLEEAP